MIYMHYASSYDYRECICNLNFLHFYFVFSFKVSRSLVLLESMYIFNSLSLVMYHQELTDLLNAPVVFAHNDLLSGNLMLDDEEGNCYFQLVSSLWLLILIFVSSMSCLDADFFLHFYMLEI